MLFFLLFLLFLFLSFILILVIACCKMAGSNSFYQEISDIEQMAFIKKWNEHTKKDQSK